MEWKREALMGLAVVASMSLAPAALAQSDPLLPFAAEPPPPPARELNLFDVFDVGDTSPLGELAVGLDAIQMDERANDYLKGTQARPRNREEADFWLRKLAILPVSSVSGYSRWALERLANEWLPAKPEDRDPITIRKLQLLWELMAISGDARALCNLGFIYETGIGVARDHEIAREWLERADAAGCPEAAAALARLE